MTQNEIATREDIQQLRDENRELKELIISLSQRVLTDSKPKTFIKGSVLRKMLGGMSENKLKDMRFKREIPYHNLNPGILFNYEEIVALMEANKVPALLK